MTVGDVTGAGLVSVTMAPTMWELLTECVTTAVESGHAPSVRLRAAVHGSPVEMWATLLGVSRADNGAVELLVTFGDDGDAVTVPAAGVVGCDWP